MLKPESIRGIVGRIFYSSRNFHVVEMIVTEVKWDGKKMGPEAIPDDAVVSKKVPSVKVRMKFEWEVIEWAEFEVKGVYKSEDPKYMNKFQGYSMFFDSSDSQQTYSMANPEAIAIFIEKWVPRFGPKQSESLKNAFGYELKSVLDSDTAEEKLQTVKWIWKARAESLKIVWDENREKREILSFLVTDCKVPQWLSERIFKFFAKNTMETIKKTPFELCRVPGVWFATADSIAIANGCDPKSRQRYAALVEFAIAQAREHGDSLVSKSTVEEEIRNYLIADNNFRPSEIKWAVESGIETAIEEGKIGVVKVDEENDGNNIYILENARKNEEEIVEKLFDMIASNENCIPLIEESKLSGLEQLTIEQRKAVKKAFSSRLSIITGGPGTGKSFTTWKIIEKCEENKVDYIVACPTNAAANRIRSIRPGTEAMTVHAMLWLKIDGTAEYGKHNKLPFKVVFVDESTMADQMTFKALLDALHPSTSIVFVWDKHQLPPVGAGSPFSDMIDSWAFDEVITELTVVKRQIAGLSKYPEIDTGVNNIVYNCNRMLAKRDKNGNLIKGLPPADALNFVVRYFSQKPNEFIGSSQRQDMWENLIAKAMKDAVERMADLLIKNWVNIKKDWQILIPQYKWEAGITSINNLLSEKLCKNSELIRAPWIAFPLHHWEKVVFSGRKYAMKDSNIVLSKWETGIVKHYDYENKKLVVDFMNVGQLELGEEAYKELEMWYAMSIHKSQGLEFPYVTIVLWMGAYKLLCNEILYTASSRGKERVYLFSEPSALEKCLSIKQNRRNTLMFFRLAGIPDEEIELVVDRRNDLISEWEKKFVQDEIRKTCWRDDIRVIRVSNPMKNGFSFVAGTIENLHEAWVKDGIKTDTETFQEFMKNDSLLFLKIRRDSVETKKETSTLWNFQNHFSVQIDHENRKIVPGRPIDRLKETILKQVQEPMFQGEKL